MAKYTPEFKQEILDSISKIGKVETINLYREKCGIRPETIRLWLNPIKAKLFAGKSLQNYHSNMINPLFREKKRILALDRYQKNCTNELPYEYSIIEQHREWDKLLINPGNYTASPTHNRIILTHQPHFYQKERELFQNNEIKQKLFTNREQYLFKNAKQINSKEILRGFKISGIYTGFSHFSPLWIKAFIDDYKPSYIYDPCGGWGHRLLGAASSNCSYIYNDFWTKTYNGVKNIISFLDLKNINVYNNDCIRFTPLEEYDTVFTCPPYNNIETYNNKMFKSDEDYFEWWQKLIRASLKPSVKYFCFVINHTYKQQLKDICEKNFNFTLLKEVKIGSNAVKSHFMRSNNTDRGEFLCTYKLPS